ncbi:hypothetical protein D9613_004099 [Agrocybe pediades]|uniref:Uncharacterized protein n=1 Tax=Agrocybe pediades TaxID=84607 RepID=A0A8H4QJF4_9AGAR|nr:hypothetical protein D9613_004099 [Agrocybe pediades]
MSSSNPRDPTKPDQPQFPKPKVTALGRLKSFGQSFVHHKPDTKQGSIVFPPPSWELSDELLGTPPALLESNYESAPKVEPPEPVSFAQKIRGLIESLPFPAALSSSPSQTDSGLTQTTPDDGKSGSPVPPGMDEDLVRMLSSEDVMNGKPSSSSSKQKEESSPGIWNILANLKGNDGQAPEPDSKKRRRNTVEEEEDGVMMYAPLEPKADSQLELANSETIREYIDESKRKSGHGLNADSANPETSSAPTTPKEHIIEKRVWVPSTTQLSLLTTWWGYRLYLPPPVMAQLDNTSLKATARAAMITTALKWLLDKIPIMLVPVQFRPAIKMLKQLSPVVSYVGVFIAWSWDRVRACDKGNGVVLTATWLLPVALIPMTWDAGDIYGPRPPPSPEEIAAAQAKQDKALRGEQGEETKKETVEEKPKKKSFFRW